MSRAQHLSLANAAVCRAENMAAEAERYANSFDNHPKVARYATAGAVWADVARAHAAIAQAMPETADEKPEN